MRIQAVREPRQLVSRLELVGAALRWTVDGARGASPNRRHGAHWSRLRKDKVYWMTILAIADGRAAVNAAYVPPERVAVRVAEWGRARDPIDNGPASFKPIIDAMRRGGYLRDDNSKVIVQVTREHLPRAGEGFAITIEPA